MVWTPLLRGAITHWGCVILSVLSHVGAAAGPSLLCCSIDAILNVPITYNNAVILSSRSLPIRWEMGFMWGPVPVGLFMGFKGCMFLTALRVVLQLGVAQIFNWSRVAEEGGVHWRAAFVNWVFTTQPCTSLPIWRKGKAVSFQYEELLQDKAQSGAGAA